MLELQADGQRVISHHHSALYTTKTRGIYDLRLMSMEEQQVHAWFYEASAHSAVQD